VPAASFEITARPKAVGHAAAHRKSDLLATGGPAFAAISSGDLTMKPRWRGVPCHEDAARLVRTRA